MATPRQASRGAPTTAGSQALSEGDFSYDVHPFRFPSATGLTPKLITARAAGGVTPRDRQPLGLFSKNAALSSFGGKFGDSTQWLTPRGEVGGHDIRGHAKLTASHRHPSGSQTERGRDRRADQTPRSRVERDRRQPPGRASRGLQSVQGVTWRFLREGPRRTTGTGSAEGTGAMSTASGGLLGLGAAQETQFQSILSRHVHGIGDADGRRSLADQYQSFERSLHRRMAEEEARERGEGDDYATMRLDMKQDPHLTSVLGDGSSSSSDDERPVTARSEHFELAEDAEELSALPSLATLQGGSFTGGDDGERLPAGEEREDGFAKGASRGHPAKSSGNKTPTMDYDEDEAYLANPAMAPCVIWHTPMRVKIAANLPHELRAEVNDDDAFVQEQRVVPDIWDHKFLPVTRRSVAAPLPKDSVKYRAHSYGAWYLPVESWGRAGEGDKKKGKKKGAKTAEEEEEQVPELLDRALKEIVKLPSSKMFYKHIKGLSAPNNRVPHYLKKLEEEGVDK